jgi:hypothetical protein
MRLILAKKENIPCSFSLDLNSYNNDREKRKKVEQEKN